MSFDFDPVPPPIYVESGRLFQTRKRKNSFEIRFRIGNGAQGTVYLSVDKGTGKKQAAKFCHKKYLNTETIERLEHQVAQRLHKVSGMFVTPRDLFVQDGHIGYVADYVEGCSVDEIVENAEITLTQALTACMILARNYAILHSLNILHGDVRESNIRIHLDGDRVRVFVLDWDGMMAPGLPFSFYSCGAPRYMAPEIMAALARGRAIPPTEATECYQLACIFHELITLRHHLTGHDQTIETMCEVVSKGKWLFDPSLPFDPDNAGYPPAILGPKFTALFRRSFSLDPDNRPSAREWEKTLAEELGNIFPCPFCGGPVFVDRTKDVCPFCGEDYPTLKFGTPSGKQIVVNSDAVTVGRSHFGDDKSVSRTHVHFRKLGPDVFAHVVGKSGMFRKNGRGWEALGSHKLVPVDPGQLLRIGNHEFKLIRCDMKGKEV